MSNEINEKVIELKMKRYKHIIEVTLGQHKGAGVKSGFRGIWDSETDGYTSEIFSNVKFIVFPKDNIFNNSIFPGYNFLFGGCICNISLLI